MPALTGITRWLEGYVQNTYDPSSQTNMPHQINNKEQDYKYDQLYIEGKGESGNALQKPHAYNGIISMRDTLKYICYTLKA